MTVFLEADARREEDFLSNLRDWKSGIPMYTPEALIPRLNALGEQGWELVHIIPVIAGDKHDVLINTTAAMSSWTNRYFCAFKRERTK